MINRYLAPCRYCGGTVPPDSGTMEKIGQSWMAAHVACAQAKVSPHAAPAGNATEWNDVRRLLGVLYA